jgi:hypothetical protein
MEVTVATILGRPDREPDGELQGRTFAMSELPLVMDDSSDTDDEEEHHDLAEIALLDMSGRLLASCQSSRAMGLSNTGGEDSLAKLCDGGYSGDDEMEP